MARNSSRFAFEYFGLAAQSSTSLSTVYAVALCGGALIETRKGQGGARQFFGLLLTAGDIFGIKASQACVTDDVEDQTKCRASERRRRERHSPNYSSRPTDSESREQSEQNRSRK